MRHVLKFIVFKNIWHDSHSDVRTRALEESSEPSPESLRKLPGVHAVVGRNGALCALEMLFQKFRHVFKVVQLRKRVLAEG